MAALGVIKVKKRLEKRLVYLYSGELISIIIFVFVSYAINLSFGCIIDEWTYLG